MKTKLIVNIDWSLIILAKRYVGIIMVVSNTLVVFSMDYDFSLKNFSEFLKQLLWNNEF